MAPTIVVPCSANINLVAPQGSTTIPVVWTEPSAEDNSGSVTITNNFSPGDSFPIGTTTVRYAFADAAGNSASCSFLVTIEAPVITDVTPPVITVQCPTTINLVAPQGSTSVAVTWTEPRAVDDSGLEVTTISNFNPGDQFPIGTSTVTYIFIDPSGNTAECSFQLIIQAPVITDVTPPVITIQCPTTINLVAPQGSTFATVTWTEPRAVDDSGLEVTTISNFNPGDQFPIGTSTVTYTFIDPFGNTEECSFPVIIQGLF
ncbi:Hyalin [Holothuria leucospilota]|uniref:Hyalin n=1 Tax=Holothuria leucospilota TaxID=206669 RepID=A0A9Q1BMK2_HOLLE|nr:Hyalin [Holothuria leucospilota]